MHVKMLVVELNKENIEYDVHSLVKAFFPEEQVAVLIPYSFALRQYILFTEAVMRD